MDLAWQVIGGSVMSIFVFGDSFAANPNGWVRLLGSNIINFSENGIGEYKIYKKVLSNTGFDKAIICHTSPWRVHTRKHPIHKNDSIRRNNDFMLNDVEYYSKKNKNMKTVHEFLKNYYDPDYQLDVYKLILKELLLLKNTIHITFHDPKDTVEIANNYHHIWKQHPGDINHMSIEGNHIIAEEIKKLIKNITNEFDL